MTKLLTLSIALRALTSITSLSAAGNADVTPGVLPPHSKLCGKTYGEWTGEWLKFVFSIPADRNPYVTRAGAVAGQNGPVSFIVGGFSGGDVNVTVPVGKGVFLPVFFTAFGTCPENTDPNFQPAPGQTIGEFLTEFTTSIIDFLTDVTSQLTVEIDGAPVKDPFQYRANSGVITFSAHPTMGDFMTPCRTGAGRHEDFVDGYWLMLAPLSKGQHAIHVSLTWGPPVNFSPEVTFHLTVE